MSTSQEKFDALTALIKTKVPNFEHRFKNESTLDKIIAFLVKPFNKNYSTNYITTIYPHVYWPNRDSIKTDWAWQVLAHEYVHLMDTKRSRVWFVIKYGSPQLLALLAFGAIGAIWNLWFLLCLLFLLFLAPIPSLGRTWAEMRGYTMSMAATIWMYGDVSDYEQEFYKEQFTGWAYYKMCPCETKVATQLRINIARIKDGSILTPEENEPFRDVHKMLQDLGDIPPKT